MRSEKTVAEYIRQATHYIEIGQTEVYLTRDDDAPWNLVTDVEPGGTHRLDIPVSVVFRAKHPCGLTFRWYFDLEDREAQGRGVYMIRVKAIESAFMNIPRAARQSFKNILANTAAALAVKAREYQHVADDQREQAKALANLCG